jgi:hypothetical protein
VRALLAIAVRELRDRWTLVAASFAGGFVLLAIALREGGRALPIAVLAAVPSAWGVALMMGGSVIARDLGEGRLGFFYARPIPWWAIGGGKLLAALLLAPAAALAGVLPALVAERNPAGLAALAAGAVTGGALAMQLALLLAFAAFGHAAAVVYRSRAPWAALDVLLFAATAGAALLAFRAFVRLGVITSAQPPHPWLVALVLAVIALVPLSATGAQLALGRSDPRRSHLALSVTFWTGTLVLAAGVSSLLLRELWAKPAAFGSRQVTRAADGGRLVALLASEWGAGGRRRASFLLDTDSGRSLRIPALALAGLDPSGSHAVWVEDAPFWRLHELDLRLLRLAGPRLEVETVPLDPPLPGEPVRDLVLAAAGERVAIVQSSTLSLHELPSGRSFSRSAAADGEWVKAAFLPDGRVRALRRVRAVAGRGSVRPGFVEIVELAGGAASSRTALDAVGHALLASPLTGSRVLLFEPVGPRTVSLHDVAGGSRLRTFAGEGAFGVHDAALLSDGTVALIESSRGAYRLRLASDGASDRLVELESAPVLLGGELPRGRIAVGLLPAGGRQWAGDTLVVEVASGRVVRRLEGLLPASLPRLGGGHADPSEASTLFGTRAGAIVRLDPETLAQSVVLEAAPSR